MKNTFNKWLTIFKSEEGNNKKKIQNLVFFLIILIITIISINLIWNDTNKKTDSNSSGEYKQLAINKDSVENNNNNNSEMLEEKLKSVLSKMNGVGETEVLITYSESSEDVYLYNETSQTTVTKETDSAGGNRDTNQTDTKKEVVYKDENGENVPITQKIINPKIEGALILAQGANNANIKNNIILAVEALTGLPTHKIQVFEM